MKNKSFIIEIEKPKTVITKMKMYKLKKDLHLEELNKFDKISDEYIRNIMFINNIYPDKIKEEKIFNHLYYNILYLLD